LLLCATHQKRGRCKQPPRPQWFYAVFLNGETKFAQFNSFGWYDAKDLVLVEHPVNDLKAVALFQKARSR